MTIAFESADEDIGIMLVNNMIYIKKIAGFQLVPAKRFGGLTNKYRSSCRAKLKQEIQLSNG